MYHINARLTCPSKQFRSACHISIQLLYQLSSGVVVSTSSGSSRHSHSRSILYCLPLLSTADSTDTVVCGCLYALDRMQ